MSIALLLAVVVDLALGAPAVHAADRARDRAPQREVVVFVVVVFALEQAGAHAAVGHARPDNLEVVVVVEHVDVRLARDGRDRVLANGDVAVARAELAQDVDDRRRDILGGRDEERVARHLRELLVLASDRGVTNHARVDVLELDLERVAGHRALRHRDLDVAVAAVGRALDPLAVDVHELHARAAHLHLARAPPC